MREFSAGDEPLEVLIASFPAIARCSGNRTDRTDRIVTAGTL